MSPSPVRPRRPARSSMASVALLCASSLVVGCGDDDTPSTRSITVGTSTTKDVRETTVDPDGRTVTTFEDGTTRATEAPPDLVVEGVDRGQGVRIAVRRTSGRFSTEVRITANTPKDVRRRLARTRARW
jgi:hypothetical protein